MFSFFETIFTKATSLVVSAFIAVGLIYSTPAHPVTGQPAAVIQSQKESTRASEPSKIERLRKEIDELKKPKSTIQKLGKATATPNTQQIPKTPPISQIPVTQSNQKSPKPQTFKLPNGAIIDEQGNILNKVEMDKTNAIAEQNRIINEIIRQKQEEAKIAQEQENLRRQTELQRLQEEQNRTSQINSLLGEYQQKVSDIDAQILAIKQQYYRDVDNEKRRAVSQPFLDGMINKLTNDANWKIEQLQLEKESLRLLYLNKVNSVQ